MRKLLMSLAVVTVAAVPALAQAPPNCQAMIDQVKSATNNRLDYSAYRAMDLVAVAEQLLKANRPAECAIKVQEAANEIQLTLRQ
jgi:squalene cyclase